MRQIIATPGGDIITTGMRIVKPNYPAWGWSTWLYRKKQQELKPIGEKLSGDEQHRILRRRFRNVHVLDRYAKVAKLDQALKVWREEGVGDTTFVDDEYDCDDFAFDGIGVWHRPKRKPFAAMALYLCWVTLPDGGGHMLNGCIDAEGFKIAEPQNKAAFPMPANWKGYLVIG